MAILILALVGGAALLGPLLTGDPDVPNYTNSLVPPDSAHLLGTDEAGRDLLARTLWGARISLGSALLVTAITAVTGLLMGVLSGCAGGVLDTIVSRLIDVLLGLPGLIVTLAIVGLLGPGFLNLTIAMSATGWAVLARLARATSRQTMHLGHVKAARMAGASLGRVALEHVLPAAASGVAVVATLGIGEVVIALAGLSFLGLGAQPPTAEWGTMLADARQTLAYAPWQILGPGTGLVATVLAATMLSEALRDVTSPGAGH
ncbi:ABC transporter permease [Nonomuraea purpurea]|uniref:ABC transporter permease n=1 Tax=Nonomuraea purpurea TaxID=1849276 RepID=A0ABV8GRE5_9ACTN